MFPITLRYIMPLALHERNTLCFTEEDMATIETREYNDNGKVTRKFKATITLKGCPRICAERIYKHDAGRKNTRLRATRNFEAYQRRENEKLYFMRTLWNR